MHSDYYYSVAKKCITHKHPQNENMIETVVCRRNYATTVANMTIFF